MTQHTPGPWHVIERLEHVPLIDSEAVVADGPKLIAEVRQPTSHISPVDAVETCRANARLIAAAPELLKALQTLVGAIDPPDVKDTVPTEEWARQPLDVARAAIAKATEPQEVPQS